MGKTEVRADSKSTKSDSAWLHVSLKQGIEKLRKENINLEKENAGLHSEVDLLRAKLREQTKEKKKLQKKEEELISRLKSYKARVGSSVEDVGHEYDHWEVCEIDDNEYGSSGDEAENLNNKQQEAASGGKNITFHGDVEGQTIMAGNETAVISEGGPLQFVDPLKSNSMLNKDASLDVTPAANAGGTVKVDIDGTLVGNDTVNIQSNTQTIYLPGSGKHDAEVEESDEKVKYKAATQDELASFLQDTIEKAEMEGRLEEVFDEETLSGLDDDLKMKAIARMAKDPKNLTHSESFLSFCEKLSSAKVLDLKSVGAHLDHFSRINLSGMSPDFGILEVFFSCFESKIFDWIILRNSHIKSSDFLSLADSLGNCQVRCLDFSGCDFELGAFAWLEHLLSHSDNVVLQNLTSAEIFVENDETTRRKFTENDALRVSECIYHVAKNKVSNSFGVDLAGCDLTSLSMANKFTVFVPYVSSLSFMSCSMSPESMEAIFSKINKLERLDLRYIPLRTEGMRKVALLLDKVEMLLLSGILAMDDDLEPILQHLEKRDSQIANVLDLSYNVISSQTVSRLRVLVDKGNVVLLSKEQMSEPVMEDAIKVTRKISENGTIYDGNEEYTLSHWIIHRKNADMEFLRSIAKVIALTALPVNMNRCRCSECDVHIAFAQDLVPSPCDKINRDHLFAFYENKYYVASRHARLAADEKQEGLHSCGTYSCALRNSTMRRANCQNCGNFVGWLYSNGGMTMMWLLCRESPFSWEVGGTKKFLKAVKSLFSAN